MAALPESKFGLLRRFGDFYAEIFRLKQLAQKGTAESEASLAPSDPRENDHAGNENKNAIWGAVAELLDRNVPGNKPTDDPNAAEVQRELLYIMTAVADEIFVRLESPEGPYWQANLFEERLFHSHEAGERIFRNIETVLARQDEAASELATVYLAALVLGFRGNYRGKDDSGVIESYRRRLESVLQPFSREPDSKHVPPPPGSESAQRQGPNSLPDLKRRPLRFAEASEVQLGASSKREPASMVPPLRPGTTITRGALIAVLSFAVGVASGLFISSRLPGVSHEASTAARQSPSANAAVPSSGKSPAGSQQDNLAGESERTVAKTLSKPSSEADIKANPGPPGVVSKETPRDTPEGHGPSNSSATPARIESFTVEVGAFHSKENAARIAESLKTLGYQPKILRRTDADAQLWHVVRVGPYPDWQTAFAAARKLSSIENLGLEPSVRPVY